MPDIKHTPGPWNAVTYPGAFCRSLITSDHGWIGRLHSFQNRQHEANARLIAKAPEMYEALTAVNNYFVDLQNKCALTAPDERAWKLVSKILTELNE